MCLWKDREYKRLLLPVSMPPSLQFFHVRMKCLYSSLFHLIRVHTDGIHILTPGMTYSLLVHLIGFSGNRCQNQPNNLCSGNQCTSKGKCYEDYTASYPPAGICYCDSGFIIGKIHDVTKTTQHRILLLGSVIMIVELNMVRYMM